MVRRLSGGRGGGEEEKRRPGHGTEELRLGGLFPHLLN